jgi:hypothetical protein
VFGKIEKRNNAKCARVSRCTDSLLTETQRASSGLDEDSSRRYSELKAEGEGIFSRRYSVREADSESCGDERVSMRVQQRENVQRQSKGESLVFIGTE